MNIQRINTTSFGRKLTAPELQEYSETLTQAKQVVGQTGNSVLIIHDACLPQSAARNTGVANLAGTDSTKFFEFAKNYLGINAIEVLPQGQVFSHDGSYCAYSGSSISLGNHQINLELLQTPEYEKLLTPQEFEAVVNANTAYDKEKIANWKNVMDNGSPQDIAARKAYERFAQLPADSPLKKGFSAFFSQNVEWLERKGIFEILAKKYGTSDPSKWPSKNDRYLYSLDDLTRMFRIDEISRQNKEEANFQYFKQFIAEKQLIDAKNKLNQMGLKLYGDFPIGFSHDEVWAFPQAFKKDHFIGLPEWRIPALDLDNVLNEGSISNRVLKMKLAAAARRYDSLRMDSAWGYIRPIITPAGEKQILDQNRRYFGSKLLDYMENYLKEQKGASFSPKSLIYEFEAAPNEFSMWENGSISPAVKDRMKALSTTFMKANSDDRWGFYTAYLEKDLKPFSIAVGNHDTQPLRQIALDIPDRIASCGLSHKSEAIPALAEELKIDLRTLESPKEFARAKWADAMMAENNHMFYMDVFGRSERFNEQIGRTRAHFSCKIPSNFEDSYIKAIKDGFGFNPMDALEKLFKLDSREKRYPELLAKIKKFKEILLAPEPNIIKGATDAASGNKKLKTALTIGISFAAGIIGGIIYKKSDNTTVSNQKQQPQQQFISVKMDDFLKHNSKSKAS